MILQPLAPHAPTSDAQAQCATSPPDPLSEIGNRISGPLNITLSPFGRTFHPSLRLTIHPSAPPVPPPHTAGCYALISISLPDALFIDKDELGDRWGMRESPMRPFDEAGPSRLRRNTTMSGDSAGAIPALRAWTVKPDIIDIERPVRKEPVYILNRAGETVEEVIRLNLALELQEKDTEVEVPLHGRYLLPGEKGETEVVLFGEGGGELRGGWMCAMSEDPDQIFAQPPPSHAQIDSPGKFCITIPVSPLPLLHAGPITLTLPAGTASHQVPVEIGTIVAIWAGWAYLVRKIWLFSRRAAAVQREKRGRGGEGEVGRGGRMKVE